MTYLLPIFGRKNKTILSILLIAVTMFLSANFTFSQSWNALTTGTSSSVYASAIFNGQLVIAGTFTTAGGVTVNNIAAWNGTTWSALGSGTNGYINALTIYNGQLVAGGLFSTAGGNSANNIARWNGSTWSAFGLGTNGEVLALIVYANQLRAGGDFTTVGGVNANRVARFDGTNWFAMGSGTNGSVWSLGLFGADLIIGGSFTQAGGATNNRIVRYNTNTGVYTAMGTGIDNGSVYAMFNFGGQLSVGGSFTTIGGSTVNRIARWTGSNWTTQGNGMNGSVWSFSQNGSNLIVGGSFTNAGGTSANGIANWNGSSFGAYGSGMSGGGSVVYTSNTYTNALYAGGNFTNAGTSPVAANNIAAWGSVPQPPNLISPLDGSQGVTITPLLNWDSSAFSYTFGLQLSLNPNFTTTVINLTGIPISQQQVSVNNNTTYFWRANASNSIGTSGWSSIRFFTTAPVGIINTNEIPETFSLHQNFPNPFNPTTTIKFDLPNQTDAKNISLKLYDMTGREVSTLINTDYVAGKWEFTLDGSKMASGVYFYKIEAGQFVQTNKMMLVK